MPRFSIVIPTLNRAELLLEALASVFAQTFRDFEVIVVDGGSTDGAREKVEAKYTVCWLYQPIPGPGPARNLGCARASGEYIVFLDSDDLWFPWTLSTLDEVIKRRSPAILCYSVARFKHVEELASVIQLPLDDQQFGDMLSFAAHHCRHPRTQESQHGYLVLISTCSLALHAELFRSSGGFSEERIGSEDLELAFRLSLAGPVSLVLEPPLVGYRRHDLNLSLDLANNNRGIKLMCMQEKAGIYPGDLARKDERMQFLASILRHAIYHNIRAGQWRLAIDLYIFAVSTFFRVGRWRSLVGLPAVAAIYWLRSSSKQ